jgi:TRAP-type C4-dicarboxylate transport system permease small subunit
MDTYIRFVHSLSRLCGTVATLLLISAIMAIIHMVVQRYIFNLTTSWQTEYVIYALAGATFIGSPFVLLEKGHVNVELLPYYLGPKGKLILAIICSVLSLMFCIVIFILSCEVWLDAYVNNHTTGTLWNAALWKLYISLPIGFFVMILQYVADIVSLITKREMPFPPPVLEEVIK